jgi:uncharacterized membrane protein (DUF106 family)
MQYYDHYRHFFSPYMFGWLGLYVVGRLIVAFVLRATRKKKRGEYE